MLMLERAGAAAPTDPRSAGTRDRGPPNLDTVARGAPSALVCGTAGAIIPVFFGASPTFSEGSGNGSGGGGGIAARLSGALVGCTCACAIARAMLGESTAPPPPLKESGVRAGLESVVLDAVVAPRIGCGLAHRTGVLAPEPRGNGTCAGGSVGTGACGG